MRKYAAALPLVVALAVGVTGCYGPFRLTQKVHQWNGDVSKNKWVVEGVFLGLVILPVYAFSAMGDAILFNSIEFWGGKNPIAAKKEIRSIERDGRQAVMTYAAQERRLRVDSFDKGRLVSTIVFEPEGDRMVARDASGALLMSAKSEGGMVILRDAQGAVAARKPFSDFTESGLALR